MSILPEIFDKHAKYKPWLWEKYYATFDHTKMQKQRAENEAAKESEAPMEMAASTEALSVPNAIIGAHDEAELLDEKL